MIDVISPINSAFERSKQILFTPFNMEKWVALALASFLIQPFNSGFSGNWGTRTPSYHSQFGDSNLHEAMGQIQAFFSPVVIMACLIVFMIIVGITVLLSWLNARGQFMLLDNIVWNRGGIVEPWQKYASPANRLWLFNLGVVLTSFILFMTLLAAPMFWILLQANDFSSAFTPLLLLGGVSFIVYIPYLIVLGLFTAFGAPIMYRNNVDPWTAFKMSTGLILKDPIGILLMGLVLMGMGLISFIAIGILTICTLCIFACFLMIPFVSSCVLLPLTIFYRCYLLDVLAQFGPEYDVWAISKMNPPATSFFR